MMEAVYIVLLSVGAALICSMLRVHRPEIAFAVSLAIGIGALLICSDSLHVIAQSVGHFVQQANMGSEAVQVMLKTAGLTILCELGVQICCDAGESALAGRIRLACRIATMGMAMPFIADILEIISLY